MMNISASVTVVDKFGDGEEDWRHGEEEVVVWSNGAGKTLQHSKGEALGSSTSEIDVGHPCAGRDSHSRALLIASLANLGISYNVVRDRQMYLFRRKHDLLFPLGIMGRYLTRKTRRHSALGVIENTLVTSKRLGTPFVMI